MIFPDLFKSKPLVNLCAPKWVLANTLFYSDWGVFEFHTAKIHSRHWPR